ncbi:c-type cytochrome [Sedimenticola sp.]|uniref:c-type cytochrome n=1 Tax=Sedimenticola sp. TaxID=1940285 RepID=UPI003D14F325
MKTIAMFAGAALLSLGLAGNAAAADGAALFASKGCSACHGADAKSPIMPAYPKLAGQNAQYALNQMKDIKSGARNNGQTAAMKGIVMSISDEDLQAIAEWLATL